MRYETYEKINNKYVFMGWYPITNEERVIATKTRELNGKLHVYKTYLWDNGTTTECKIIIDKEVR